MFCCFAARGGFAIEGQVVVDVVPDGNAKLSSKHWCDAWTVREFSKRLAPAEDARCKYGDVALH